MSTKQKPPDDKEQSKLFAETARKIGVDETGKAFERAFKKIVPKKRAPRKRIK